MLLDVIDAMYRYQLSPRALSQINSLQIASHIRSIDLNRPGHSRLFTASIVPLDCVPSVVSRPRLW